MFFLSFSIIFFFSATIEKRLIKGEMEMYKISLLRDDILLINDLGETYRVDEVKKRMEKEKESLQRVGWYLAQKGTWEPDAHRMVLDYLENQQVGAEVNGWYSQARDLFNGEHFAQINDILNKAFSSQPELLTFYLKAEEVDIKK